MIFVRNIILFKYQFLKNINKRYNGISLAIEYTQVCRRSWINSCNMDSPSYPSLHKIHNKVDCMIYATKKILGNYKLLKNKKKNYKR